MHEHEWITDELRDKLAAITGSNKRKKRTTVLRLAEAKVFERSEESVFRLPDTCCRPAWYGVYRNGVKTPGWRDDSQIQEALQSAIARALEWQDQAEARRIAERQEALAEARDLLAKYSPLAVKRLVKLLEQESETGRKAANDILDRADEGTASKRAGDNAAAPVAIVLPDNMRGDRDDR
jgi:hypothetical protein